MYANCLIEGDLLRKYKRGGVEIYQTTEKGREFLKDYGKIKKVLDKMRL